MGRLMLWLGLGLVTLKTLSNWESPHVVLLEYGLLCCGELSFQGENCSSQKFGFSRKEMGQHQPYELTIDKARAMAKLSLNSTVTR